MDEFVKHSLQVIGLDGHTDAIIHALDSLGVDGPDDVCHLVENDLTDILKPVQVRKLLAYWR